MLHGHWQFHNTHRNWWFLWRHSWWVDKWFDTSKFDKNDNRPLPTGKNKKKIGKFKDELNGQIMTEFIALRTKTYAFTQIN